LRDALPEILEDILPWLKDNISPSEASTPRDPEPVSEEMQGTEEAVQRSPNLEQLQEALQY